MSRQKGGGKGGKGKSNAKEKGKGKRKGFSPGTSRRPSSPKPSSPWQRDAKAYISLADEAWMTTHRTMAFETSRKLRHSPVQFVSAGLLQGTIKESISAVDIVTPACQSTSLLPPSSPETTEAIAQMTIRSRPPSPSPSESSSNVDQVVFRGRGHTNCSRPVSTISTKEVTNSSTSKDLLADDSTLNVVDAEIHTSSQVKLDPADPSPVNQHSDSDADGIVQNHFVKRRNGETAREGYVSPSWLHQSEPDVGWRQIQQHSDLNVVSHDHDHDSLSVSAMDDYMQNADELDLTGNVSQMFAFSRRVMDVDFSNHCDWESMSEAQGEDVEEALSRGGDWPGMQDLEDLSTSSDMTSDEDVIDDEAIAIALQEQEHFGLDAGESLFRTESTLFGELIEDFGKSHRKRQSRVGGHHEKVFPSASAMVDALQMDPYNGFDVMDTERPSLKRKKKARRGRIPPELESSELNQQLQHAWETDRTRKKAKKAERELLRQVGLLGRAGKAADLKVKYPAGIHMRDVVEEIREFLLSDNQSLSLPPMEAHRRASVHQISRYFNLTSRSRGDGPNRFTVLAKNSRTRIWTNDEMEDIMQRKDFLKRLHNNMYLKDSTRPFKRKGSWFENSLHAISYKDGETVGANAPELGPENRGHVLLSKMGWSKGSGLGVHNEGILEPISQRIKTNRNGLL